MTVCLRVSVSVCPSNATNTHTHTHTHSLTHSLTHSRTQNKQSNARACMQLGLKSRLAGLDADSAVRMDEFLGEIQELYR